MVLLLDKGGEVWRVDGTKMDKTEEQNQQQCRGMCGEGKVQQEARFSWE